MWVAQGLGSAAFESCYSAASHSIGHRWSTFMIAWWQRIAAALFISAFALCWRGTLPHAPVTARFWIPAALSIALNTGTSLLYVRALRHDLSLTIPITALSPVFLLASEPLMTGRAVPLLGMCGVGVIAIGLYVLNLPVLRTHGLLGPFKNVWREAGPRMMLIVVVIWAVTAPLDKLAVAAYDPLWYSVTLHGGIAILLTPLLWRQSARDNTSIRGAWRLGALGILSGSGSMLQMTALLSAPVTYVIALRRFSAPLSALWGWLFFKEPHIAARLLGTFIMTAGAVILLLSL